MDQAVSELWGRVQICHLSLIWPLTYKKSLIVILQQTKEVIANGHKNLNRMIISQTP